MCSTSEKGHSSPAACARSLMASGVFSAFTRSIILMTTDPQWTFKVGGALCNWLWANGGPDITRLESVRSPTSTEYSRHVPVHAYSATMKRVLPLESGLEFELVLWLDRRSDVECLVPQPCRITSSEGMRHVPDLLERDLDGKSHSLGRSSSESSGRRVFVSSRSVGASLQCSRLELQSIRRVNAF